MNTRALQLGIVALLILIGNLILLSVARADPLLYVTLEPKEIAIGEVARLTITNLGTTSRTPPLPVVVGLQFQVVDHTRQFEFSGGNTVPSSSVIVEVRPQLVGTFYIPAIAPGLQALVLHVTPTHGPATTTGPANSNYMIRPPIQAIAPKRADPAMNDGPAFVRLDLPTRDVYVGESVPVDIVVGVRAGIVTALNGLPALRGGEFTLNNLSHQPEREDRVSDDKQITVLTWHSVLAAVKPGSFHLTVDTPLTIKISTRPRQDSAMDALLGDPFLQNYFGTSVSKQITISSPTSNLNVLPIPQQDRPANFNGAVGTFKVSAEITPPHAIAGDPLTLRWHVSGTGNFDRVNTELLQHLDGWKTYPPKATFKADDGIGYRGDKVFEQPMIALQPGVHTVPAIPFSYFDPGTRRFETAASSPLSITVSPALGSVASTVGGTMTHRLSAALRPDHAVSASRTRSLMPLYLRSAYLSLPPALALLLAGQWLIARRQGERQRDRQQSLRTKHALAQFDAAAQAQDAAQFLDCAGRILAEIPRPRADEDDADIQALLALIAEHRYGHPIHNTVDYSRWSGIVHRAVKEPSR